MKKGILVVSFGTTYKDTRKNTIEAVESMVQEAYPDIKCYRAFSSGTVRRRLREREGLMVMDTHEALAQMMRDGITHVYIQPTYIIDGIESNRLKEEAKCWGAEFVLIHIGAPLLTNEEDYEKVAEALRRVYRDENEQNSLVLIGHGSDHEAHESYERLEKTFRRMGHQGVYVATVEGKDDMEELIDRMGADGNTEHHVILAPFMLVAGDHANNDMAGDGESYLSRMCASGYRVQAVLKGLGEVEGIREVYLSHLKDIM